MRKNFYSDTFKVVGKNKTQKIKRRKWKKNTEYNKEKKLDKSFIYLNN